MDSVSLVSLSLSLELLSFEVSCWVMEAEKDCFFDDLAGVERSVGDSSLSWDFIDSMERDRILGFLLLSVLVSMGARAERVVESGGARTFE